MIEASRIVNQRYSTLLIISGSLILGMLIRKPFDTLYTMSKKETLPLTQQQPVNTDIVAQDIQTYFNEGKELLNLKKYTAATHAFKKALNADSTITESLIRIGSIAYQEEQYETAATYFKTALYIAPKTMSTYMRLGLVLHKLKELQKAENIFTLVIKNAPEYSEAYTQLARVLMDAEKLDRAIVIGKKAIELSPENIHTYLNLGHIYNKKGDIESAKKMYTKALNIDSNFPNANYNLGYTLRLEGKLRESIPYLEKALALQPYYPDARIALAQAHWGLNDFASCWKHYDYRWQLHGVDPKKLHAPLWDGSDLHGKTILLYAEQGFGDTLQFIRFAQEVKKRGARVICKVQEPLKQLLSAYPYIDKIIGKESSSEKIDVQAALMSIPGIINTTSSTIPAEVPYLKASPTLSATWKEKLSPDKNIKIGLCWKVDPQHELTKSPLSLRSMPLSTFAALADIPGVSFYSLQKTHDVDEFKNIPTSFTVNTFNPSFDEAHGRFMDTAAVIDNLDLVISVDTAVAHIAGALGKQVWMLLPQSPDCRWHFEGNTTAWYPTMRLFRQQDVGDFEEPIQHIKKELVDFIKKRTTQ